MLKPNVQMLLAQVFHLLWEVHSKHSVNKMNSYNLAIVWTPNLVRSDDTVQDFAMCGVGGGGTLGTVIKLCIDHLLFE